MAAGEDARGREATLREARAVRAPANELELRLEARASHRLLSILGIQHVEVKNMKSNAGYVDHRNVAIL
jgi:hypothetical protein